MTKLMTQKASNLILIGILTTGLVFSLSMNANAQSSGSGGEFGSAPSKPPISFNKIPFGSQTGTQGSPTTQAPTKSNNAFVMPKVEPVQQNAQTNVRPRVAQKGTILPRQEKGSETLKRTGFGRPAPNTTKTGDRPGQTSGGRVQPLPKFEDLRLCNVGFIDDIKLPAREVGVINTLDAKEGQFVKAGSVVGQIDDDLYQKMLNQAQLRYGIAKETALDTSAVEAARKKLQVASIEANRATKLARSGSKSDSERMMAIYTKDLAGLELVKAEREREKAFSEAQLALAQKEEVTARLQRHVLQVGFDCYVIEIMKHAGEHVNVGDEVMRIARMDKLEVEGTVDFNVLNAHEIMNRPVTVTVLLARNEKQTFEGRITHVALERQTRDRYKVKAEINNRPIGGHWVLQPNMTVDMRIHLDSN